MHARLQLAIDAARAPSVVGQLDAGEQADQAEFVVDVALPEQVKSATQFATNAEGRIDLVPDPPSHAGLADSLQREIYQEVRHKALTLSALGHNQLADLSETIDRFLAATPERIENVSITRLWSRGNTLRRRFKAHETEAASNDPTDPARLPALVAETLRDLVESYNVFIVGDPKGRELDQVRFGPQERDAARQVLDCAVPIVEAVKASERLTTPAAKEALTEQVEAALDAAPGVDNDQATDLARKTTSNFIVEILRVAYAPLRKLIAEAGFAWKEVRAGTYRSAGPAGIGAAYFYSDEIMTFIVDNASNLKVFVEHAFHNPTLIRIIELIAGGS